MISIYSENCNRQIQQLDYDACVNRVIKSPLLCSGCKQHSIMKIHAYYNRTLYDGVIIIESYRIMRVRCKHCKKTHALLPTWIIPYNRINYHTSIEIIDALLFQKSAIYDKHLHLGVDIIKSLTIRFKAWINTVKQFTWTTCISGMIHDSFLYTSKMFLMVRRKCFIHLHITTT